MSTSERTTWSSEKPDPASKPFIEDRGRGTLAMALRRIKLGRMSGVLDELGLREPSVTATDAYYRASYRRKRDPAA